MACSVVFLFLCAFQTWGAWGVAERERQGWAEVFLSDSAQLDSVVVKSKRLSGSKQVRVIDKSMAKSRFIERFGPEMLQALDSNPLPISVRLRLEGSSQEAESIVLALSRIPGVESVDSPKDDLEGLERMRFWGLRVGGSLTILLFGVVFGVIRNSVQLSLKSRDRLIDNMRILGASRWQIEAPFAFEGLLQGALGGCLASGIPWAILWGFRSYLPIPVPLAPQWGLFAGLATFAFAALAGGAGGWWTVRRAFR